MTDKSPPTHHASCLCGAVDITVTGDLSGPDACHCVQCRKQSGHYWASTNVARAAVTIIGSDHVTWFASSAKVRRGFCGQCGAVLFWDPIEQDYIAIAMGAFDAPTHTHLDAHIFADSKGDYYDIADGVHQKGSH